MAFTTLIEAAPLTPDTSTPVAIRLAGGGSRAYTHKGFNDWRSGIVSPLRMSAQLGYDENGWTGEAVPATGKIQFMPASRTLLSTLSNLYWKGARITISHGDDASAAPTWSVEMTGTVADISTDSGVLTITLSDLSGDLVKVVCADTFAGTGDLEGGTDAVGRIKRRSFGYCYNIEGRLLDSAYNIYEFGDPARPIYGYSDVRDKGYSASSLGSVAWQGSAAATLTALRNATAPGGGGVVAPSINCVKWWTQPSGPLTADLSGELSSSGQAVNTAPDIVVYALQSFDLTIGFANYSEAVAWNYAGAGVHCDDSSETMAQLFDRLLVGISLLWTLDGTGAMYLCPIEWTGSIEALQADTISRDATFQPTLSRKLGFQRNYRIQSDSEISAAITGTDVTYADGTPIEVLKPAQAGADKTSINQAASIYSQGPGATASASSVLNSYLTINADGTLTNGGGGQVTFTGIGGGPVGQLGSIYFGNSLFTETLGGIIATLSNFKTLLGTSAAISGQGPWATFGLATAVITAPSTNLFPYPRPTYGTDPATQGWLTYFDNGGSGFSGIGVNDYPGFGGFSYEISRSSGGAEHGGGYIDFPVTPESLPYTISTYARCAGGAFQGYCYGLNADKSAAVTSATGLTYIDSDTLGNQRFAATITPSGGQTMSFIRIHMFGNWPALSSYQDIYWWGVKVERGSTATPYTDPVIRSLTSNSMLYFGGVNAESLRPAQYGADVTSGNQAASIAGQGAFATAGQLNASNVFGAYFASNAFSLNYTLTRADGTSTVTESLAITQYGTAAAIFGQGGLATSNSVDTPTIQPNAATQIIAVSLGSPVTGNGGGTSAGSIIDVMSYSLSLAYDADIVVFLTGRHVYSNTALPKSWQVFTSLDGSADPASLAGGGNFGTDSFATSSSRHLNAGTRSIDIYWAAQGNITLNNAKMIIFVSKR